MQSSELAKLTSIKTGRKISRFLALTPVPSPSVYSWVFTKHGAGRVPGAQTHHG